MTDRVLTDEQARVLCQPCNIGGPLQMHPCNHEVVRLVESATLAALAAEAGVDVEELAQNAIGLCCVPIIDPPHLHGIACEQHIAATIRTALAAQVARVRELDEELGDEVMVRLGAEGDRDALRQRVEAMRDALIWCSGSADFAPEGQARDGWERCVKPLLDATRRLPGAGDGE